GGGGAAGGVAGDGGGRGLRRGRRLHRVEQGLLALGELAHRVGQGGDLRRQVGRGGSGFGHGGVLSVARFGRAKKLELAEHVFPQSGVGVTPRRDSSRAVA